MMIEISFWRKWSHHFGSNEIIMKKIASDNAWTSLPSLHKWNDGMPHWQVDIRDVSVYVDIVIRIAWSWLTRVITVFLSFYPSWPSNMSFGACSRINRNGIGFFLSLFWHSPCGSGGGKPIGENHRNSYFWSKKGTAMLEQKFFYLVLALPDIFWELLKVLCSLLLIHLNLCISAVLL